MTADDAKWAQQRSRAISAAFQTGRPVFADTDGELRYADGDRERLPDNGGLTAMPILRAPAVIRRVPRAYSRAAATAAVAAGIHGILGFWHPWHFALAAILAVSACVWFYARHQQLVMERRKG